MVNTQIDPVPGGSDEKGSRMDRRCPEFTRMGAPDTCMALAGETPIPTPDGWVFLRDIEPGQMVFDERGEPCSVTSVCRRGPEPVCRFTFDDRSFLLAGEQHHWVTSVHRQRQRVHQGRSPLSMWAVPLFPANTGEIRDSLVFQQGTLVLSRHSVPLPRPLQCPEAELPVDPYLLGIWLGDGTAKAAIITCHRDDEPHYRERALSAGENWWVLSKEGDVLTCSLARGSKPLFLTRLRQLGVYRNKHIPPLYLRAGREQRVRLLEGLMDSDGYIDPRQGVAEFTSTSERLATGTRELVLSLGQKATLNKGDAVLKGRRISDKWRVAFSPSIVVVSLPRKVAALETFLDRRRKVALARTGQRYIRSIKPAGQALTFCVAVDSLSRMMLAGGSMIPVRTAGVPWVPGWSPPAPDK